MTYTPTHARPAGRGLGRRLLGVAALTASFLVPIATATSQAEDPTCPTNPEKCYSFTMAVSPASPGPGDLATYTGTLKNLSRGGAGVTLGSANITWSPADAFYDITLGGVTPQGTMTRSGSTLQLRNLGAAPGQTRQFTFSARAIRGGTVTYTSTAKQANNYSGVGNDLSLYGSSPSTATSSNCSGSIEYDAYGCRGIMKSQGGTVTTGGTASDGDPSLVPASITFAPVTPFVGSSPVQVMAIRTYLDGEACPVDVATLLDCTFVLQLLNKIEPEYNHAGQVSATIYCGSLCDTLAVVLFQEDETTGTKEPVLPCGLPINGGLLSGSQVCYVNNGDGTITVNNNTNINDWKVMGVALAE
jgi:hypothetical protein